MDSKGCIACPGQGADHSSYVCYLTTPDNCILIQLYITDLTYPKLVHFSVDVQMQLCQEIPK